MIPTSEISVLKSAAELLTVSINAEAEQLEGAIARTCNLAANTGASQVEWVGVLNDILINKLTTKGYTVTRKAVPEYISGKKIPEQMKADNVWIISWKAKKG